MIHASQCFRHLQLKQAINLTCSNTSRLGGLCIDFVLCGDVFQPVQIVQTGQTANLPFQIIRNGLRGFGSELREMVHNRLKSQPQPHCLLSRRFGLLCESLKRLLYSG